MLIQDESDIETGRLLFAKDCSFIRGIKALDQLPDLNLPEVAFAGRSNVGKSSLINALTNRKSLARTSNTPGRTREINFFNLDDRLCLADLPGYGYARVSRKEVTQWTRLIKDYFRQRTALKRVYLLIDARRGILDADDGVMEMLDKAALSHQVILTKMDKLKETQGAALRSTVSKHLRTHPTAHPDILATSSSTGLGLAQMRAAIAALAN